MAGVAAFAFAGAVTAQSVIEQAVADLCVRGRQQGACATLIRAGENGAAALRPLLQKVEDADPEQACMALYVLGRLGGDAAAALPEVLHAFGRGMQPEVRRQALWAIGQIAPAAAKHVAGTCEACIDEIRRNAASDIDRGLVACVMSRLRLGPSPGDDRLVSMLGGTRRLPDKIARYASNAVIASADAYAARFAAGAGADGRSAAVEAALVDALGTALGGDFPWDRQVALQMAAGALAFASWQAGARGPLIARGLLQHWDPEMRQQGLQALFEPAGLSLHDRFDVVLLLADGDLIVRDVALGTLAGWGSAAAVALPVLHVSAGGSDKAFAAACRTFAERWLTSLPPPAADLAKGAWGALLGDPVAAFDERQLDAAAEELLAAIAVGCRGTTGGRIGRVAAFVRHNSLQRPSVVDAFVRCLATDDVDAWREALHALAILGPTVAKVRGDIEVLLLRSAPLWDVNVATALAGEAWIRTGPGATVDDLRQAIESDRWHVALRGMCEVVRRGALAPAVADAAASALPRRWGDMHVTQGEQWARMRGGLLSFVTVEPDAQALAAAAGIVLFAAGDDRWRTHGTLPALAAALGLRDAEAGNVEARLAELRTAGGLASLCNRLEAAVPALSVGWPPDGAPPTAVAPR